MQTHHSESFSTLTVTIRQERAAIGRILRDARIERGISQEQLAHRLGLRSGQSISNIERGSVNPRWAHLPLLAEFLGLNPITLKERYLRIDRMRFFARRGVEDCA